MSWKNQESWEPWLVWFWVNRHSKMQKQIAINFFFWRFWATIMDLLALWYQILFLLVWYQEQSKLVKYCLSSISTFRIIKLKKCKIQFFSLSCLFSFFDFCLQNLCWSEKVPVKCAKQFLCFLLSSYVEGHVKKVKSEFHVFVWFPRVQNLQVFFGIFTV